MKTLQGQTDYALPRNATESERLNSQHQCYISSVGFYLRPNISKNLSSTACIADIGTGTGVWLTGLAKDSPPTQRFEGLDISSVQFPSTYADNIEFKLYDLLKPVPDEYKGRFDLIHLRLLTVGLLGDDWTLAAEHVLEMLKPEGWVQWEEADFARLTTLLAVPAAKCTAMNAIVKRGVELNVRSGRLSDAPLRLASILASVGFENAQGDLTSSDRDPSSRQLFTDVSLRACMSTIAWHSQQEPDGAVKAKEVEALGNEALEEVRDGKVYLQVFVSCVTAQKPA